MQKAPFQERRHCKYDSGVRGRRTERRCASVEFFIENNTGGFLAAELQQRCVFSL